jgi:Flp pilus assembly protein TadD
MLIRPLLKELRVNTPASCKHKIKLSLISLLLTLLGQAQAQALESKEKGDNDAATTNLYLKKELQLDRRLATYHHGQKLDVFLSLDSQDLYINLLLGSFTKGESQGSSAPAAGTQGIPQRIKLEALHKASKRGKAEQDDEVAQLSTKANTKNLLAGKAVIDLALVDEFDCPVEAEVKADDPQAYLRNGFRLAQKGELAAAKQAVAQSLALLHPNHAAYLTALNNYLCLCALTQDSKENSASSTTPKRQEPSFSRPTDEEAQFMPVLVLNLATLDYQKKSRKADEIILSLEKLPPKLPVKLALARDLLLLKLYRSTAKQKDLETLIAAMAQNYPLNPRSLCALGKLALEQKHYKEAIKYLSQAQALNPRNFSIKEELAAAYEGSGDLDAAIRIATRAANDFPEIAEGHLLLGRLHLVNKEFLGARLQFERVEELKPGFEVENRLFPLYIKLLDLSNKYDELLSRTQGWVEKYPGEPVCHYNLAIAYAKKAATQEKKGAQEKYYHQAELAYRKALQIKPRFFNAKYNLVLILCKCDNLLEADKLTGELASLAQTAQQLKDVEELKQILVKEKR